MSISILLLNILFRSSILSGILIALAHTLIALAYRNSIKKMHRLFFVFHKVIVTMSFREPNLHDEQVCI